MMKIVGPIVLSVLLSLVATVLAVSVTRLIASRGLRHDELLGPDPEEPASV